MKKLIILFFIVALFLEACTYIKPADIKTVTINNRNIVLGSSEYVSNIQGLAAKNGYRRALTAVMDDVNKHPDELDKNSADNLFRFHKLISSLIYKIGYVDMETHYFRNKLNRAPKSLKDMIALNRKLPINKRWTLLGIMGSAYHIQGKDGEYNLKFISCDGFCEAVYNKNGILLDDKTDPINMGTYNYAAGIREMGAHEKYDIAPYLKWGNTPNSPQKKSADINKGLYAALLNYKANQASVFLYRKNLFGMQQGKVP